MKTATLIAALALSANAQNGYILETPHAVDPISDRMAIIVSSVKGRIGPSVTVRAGTPVIIRLRESLDSGQAMIGERILFESLEELRDGDNLVIPAGAIAVGEVSEVERPRWRARGGRIGISLNYIRSASGQKIMLTADREAKGQNRTPEMVAGIAFSTLVSIPTIPFWFVMAGHDAVIREGIRLQAFTAGTQQVLSISDATGGEIEPM